MGSLADHLKQAQENHRLAVELLRVLPNDPFAVQWGVTMAFYAAVHCAEAHLAKQGLHSGSHANREYLMTQSRPGFPRAAYQSYLLLKRWSEQTRYLMRQYQPEFFRQEVVPELNRVGALVGVRFT